MTTAREQALALHERYQKHFAGISGNAHLSPEGKVQQLAPAYADYRDQLAKLASDDAWRKQQRQTELTRTAFGVPKDPIQAMSYRDALARADLIDDPRIAKHKIADALETGDTLMAQALAKTATDKGWPDTVQTYLDAVPSAAQAVTQLSELQAHLGDLQQHLQDSAHFTPQRPAELAQVHDNQIDAIAHPDAPSAHEQAATDFAAAIQGGLTHPAPSGF